MKKPRKAWRADLKWLFGIFATLLLTIALTSFALYRVTTNPQMEKMQKIMMSQSKNGGFDIAKMMSGSKSTSSGKNLMPKIKIKGKEYTPQQLDSMPEAELTKLMKDFDGGKMLQNFGSVANPPGSTSGSTQPDMKAFENIGKQFQDPKMMGQVIQSAAIQAIMPAITGATDAAKGFSMTLFIATLLGALFCIGLMMAFSYRFGRLSSLATVVILSALPTFIAVTFLKGLGGMNTMMMQSAQKGQQLPNPLQMLGVIGDSNFALFSGLMIFSGLLLLISLLGSIIMSMMNGSRNKAAVVPPAAPEASTSKPQLPAAKAS